ncbi:MAG: dockerin type I repeat-containing protein [Oscillospiraceae bacterium]|jgi:hypothetical protein|nr:dockerin type I repeat-containing protein [Oscillospiraceae bacterium]
MKTTVKTKLESIAAASVATAVILSFLFPKLSSFEGDTANAVSPSDIVLSIKDLGGRDSVDVQGGDSSGVSIIVGVFAQGAVKDKTDFRYTEITWEKHDVLDIRAFLPADNPAESTLREIKNIGDSSDSVPLETGRFRNLWTANYAPDPQDAILNFVLTVPESAANGSYTFNLSAVNLTRAQGSRLVEVSTQTMPFTVNVTDAPGSSGTKQPEPVVHGDAVIMLRTNKPYCRPKDEITVEVWANAPDVIEGFSFALDLNGMEYIPESYDFTVSPEVSFVNMEMGLLAVLVAYHSEQLVSGTAKLFEFRLRAPNVPGSYILTNSAGVVNTVSKKDLPVGIRPLTVMVYPNGANIPDIPNIRPTGDVNGDGAVNIADVVALARYLIDDLPLVQGVTADLDRSGELNIRDLLWLILYLRGNVPDIQKIPTPPETTATEATTAETTTAATTSATSTTATTTTTWTTATTVTVPETLPTEPSATTTVPLSGGIKGDVNLDGTVSIADIAMLVDYLYNDGFLTKAQSEAADVNGDGFIDSDDLAQLYTLI